MNGGTEEDRARLFTEVPSDRTRSNGQTLKDKKCHLNVSKKTFIVRVTKLWNRLPREIVESQTLQILEVQLEIFP